MRVAILAALLYILAPAGAAASDCGSENGTALRVDAFVGGSQTDGSDSWRQAGLGFEAPALDCRFTVGFNWETARRFGVTDESVGIVLADGVKSDGFWRTTLRSSASSAFLPRWAASFELGRAFQYGTGPVVGLVVSGETRFARYPVTDFAQVSALAEIYPRDLNLWLTLKVSQPWADFETVPLGWMTRADVPLSDTVRVFALTAAGYEADLARLDEVRTIAGGLRADFKRGYHVTIALARESRPGRPTRSDVTLSVGRGL